MIWTLIKWTGLTWIGLKTSRNRGPVKGQHASGLKGLESIMYLHVHLLCVHVTLPSTVFSLVMLIIDRKYFYESSQFWILGVFFFLPMSRSMSGLTFLVGTADKSFSCSVLTFVVLWDLTLVSWKCTGEWPNMPQTGLCVFTW